jgi:hypothetical protein
MLARPKYARADCSNCDLTDLGCLGVGESVNLGEDKGVELVFSEFAKELIEFDLVALWHRSWPSTECAHALNQCMLATGASVIICTYVASNAEYPRPTRSLSPKRPK